MGSSKGFFFGVIMGFYGDDTLVTVCYGTSPFLVGTSIISMAIFNSYVKLPEGIEINGIE